MYYRKPKFKTLGKEGQGESVEDRATKAEDSDLPRQLRVRKTQCEHDNDDTFNYENESQELSFTEEKSPDHSEMQFLGVLTCSLEALFIARFTFKENKDMLQKSHLDLAELLHKCVVVESTAFPRQNFDLGPELWLCKNLKRMEKILQNEREPSLYSLLVEQGEIPPGFLVSISYISAVWYTLGGIIKIPRFS